MFEELLILFLQLLALLLFVVLVASIQITASSLTLVLREMFPRCSLNRMSWTVAAFYALAMTAFVLCAIDDMGLLQ